MLYGGAAGGGKSYLLRVLAIVMCGQHPGINVYLFRRTFPDLWRNHLVGPSSFFELLKGALRTGGVTWNAARMTFSFSNGAKIILCHCKDKGSVYGYQGCEIHVLLMDEATQFSDEMFRYLRTRVRLGSFEPQGLAEYLPLIFCCANPGGIGHHWVKALFVDPALGKPEGKAWQSSETDGQRSTTFIPSKYSDNPHIDEDYSSALSGLGPDSLVAALRDGDWDVVSGTRFGAIWDNRKHVLPPFEIPSGWRINRSYDHGESKPFSVCWWAESPGDEIAIPGRGKRFFPKDTLIMIGEWYGWNGKPDKGLRMLAANIGRGILAREARMALAGRVGPGPADTQIWTMENGQCPADDMRLVGVSWTQADKSKGSRVAGWGEIWKRLVNAVEEPDSQPGIYFFASCEHAIRTLPVLPVDPINPDDVDTDSEDHIGDAIRYRVRRKDHLAGEVAMDGY